jgi:hypothetical protein
MKWETIKNSKFQISSAPIIIYNDLFYIFGGEEKNQLTNSMKIFNPETFETTILDPRVVTPSERKFHTGNLYNDKMYKK